MKHKANAPSSLDRPISLRETLRQGGFPGLLLFAFPALFLAVCRKRMDYSTVDGSAMAQIAYAAIAFLVAVEHLRRYPLFLRRMLFQRPLVWLFLFILLCMLSTLWSLDPKLTLWRAGQTLTFFLLILAISFRFLNKPIAYATYIVVFALWAGILIGSRRFYGDTDISLASFHGVGSYAVGPVLFVALLLTRRKSLALIAFVTCLISTSTRVYLGFLVGGASSLLFLRRPANRVFAVLVMVVVLVVAFSSGMEDDIRSLLFVGKTQEALETGGGRWEFWSYYIQLGFKQPLTGYGFAAGEYLGFESHGLTHAHNGVIAAFVGTGVVGAALVSLFYLDAILVAATRMVSTELRQPLVAACVMSCFMGMFDSAVGSSGSSTIFTWLSQCLLASLVFTCARPVQAYYGSTVAHRRSPVWEAGR